MRFEQSQSVIHNTTKLETESKTRIINRLKCCLRTPAAPKVVIAGIEGMLKAGEILQK